MRLNIEQKKALVSEVTSQLGSSQALILAENRGLSVELATQLRAKARSEGVTLRVLRNTLARRATENTPYAALADQMVGPLMYGFAKDPVAGAKVFAEFAKDNETFVIKGGAMANAVMSPADIKALATLPSRDELLAQLVGTMQAPITKLVRTLNEVPSRFARTLAAVRDQKEQVPA